jgi:acetolactate synthase-1/2/3 large subunit
MNVAEYVAKFLTDRGIKHVFGYQGGAILKLLDEMIATGKITYIQNYHEQASAFCADSYSRVTGHIGVAMATSGPGATNLITGIANAQLDSIPTFFITGQDYVQNVTRDNQARLNGFQDLDIVSIVKPITKYAVIVLDENEICYEMEKAYHLATSGRPGAVLIDIPIDIQFKEIDLDKVRKFEIAQVSETANNLRTQDVITEILNAKRPVILAGGAIQGGGVSHILKQIVSYTNIPVMNTLNGLDAIEGSYSFAGLHGNTFANLAVQNADLLIVLGARLGQRQVGKTPQNYTTAKVIHIDADCNELNRVMSENISIQADLKVFLNDLVASAEFVQFPDLTQWHQKIQEWERKYTHTTELNSSGLDPVRAARQIIALLDDDAILTNDVGQNQMWVSQAFRKRGDQRLLNSSGLGSMGYSLPASIGAKIAFPDRQVIAFTGDGGLHMNIQELMLVGQRQMGIKCIVMNNNTLGMMREVQKRYYNSHYYGSNVEEFACADLQKIAAAYNLSYIKIESEDQIKDIASDLSNDQPYIIDLRIPYDSLLSNRYDEADIFEKEKIIEWQ